MPKEAAAEGAVLVEARFGSETVLRPGFMELFRVAEARVRHRHPRLRVEAVVTHLLWYETELIERLVAAGLRAAREGLADVDLLHWPYDEEADWAPAYRVAERVTPTSACDAPARGPAAGRGPRGTTAPVSGALPAHRARG